MSKPLWQPSKEIINHSHIHHFMQQVNTLTKDCIENYDALYQWSIDNPTQFWDACAQFCEIQFSQPAKKILEKNSEIQKSKWFIDATLNFAENLLIRNDNHTALIYTNENGDVEKISYKALNIKVRQLAHHLTELGLESGDRVAGFVTNRIETVIAMLASTSVGAIWTACSPEFGIDALLDRFSQIKPKVLFTINEHQYQGKKFSHLKTITSLKSNLPSVETTIGIETFDAIFKNKTTTKSVFSPFPFDHPLYILYSSGTTGKPKCMVHGAGNVLIQHKKELMLHTDLHSSDTLFFYTTCSWMMWHWMISSLSVGATVVLYDGSPLHPKKSILLDLIDQLNVSIFGCGAKIFETYLKTDLTPKQTHQLSSLKTILTTGSPLIAESFHYIYDKIKADVRVSSISGGSDLISCFALGNPALPVYSEELQCRGLGMAVDIYDDSGQPVFAHPGELVCTKPFPTMPIYFWNDPTGEKYFHAYFSQFKNVWTHGDYAELTKHNGIVIHGRSDATLNPGGIRIGTADIYEQVLKVEEVLDCVAAGEQSNGNEEIILFIKLNKNISLSDTLETKIKKTIRDSLTPYHVPKKIIRVSDIPKTVNGKTMEILVKKIINHKPITNTETLLNPDSLIDFQQYSRS